MNSALKVLVPIGLLLATVFAVTFFSMNAPREENDPEKGGSAKSQEAPLRFFTSIRRWDPNSPNLPDRAFVGHYEVGETQHAATFWFENRSPSAVTMRLKDVSCSACSGGRVAPFPPEKTRAVLQATAASVLPTGSFGFTPFPALAPSLDLVASLPWTSHEFRQKDKVGFSVPGAANADGWSPQWGILELNFKVRPNPTIPLAAEFTSQAEGGGAGGSDRFAIYFAASNPFETDTATLDFGDLTAESPAQERVFYIASTTRTPNELKELSVSLATREGGGKDQAEFITFTPPVPLEGEGFKAAVGKLEGMAGHPLRILTAYRMAVTLRPKVGDVRLDIGPLDRILWLAVPGAEAKPIALKGTVRGPVRLAEGKELDLKTFPASAGVTNTTFELITERAGLELGLLAEQTEPKFLKVTLTKKPDRGNGLGYYELALSVPPSEQFGEISGGLVVLETKGSNAQRVRLAVKGRGVR